MKICKSKPKTMLGLYVQKDNEKVPLFAKDISASVINLSFMPDNDQNLFEGYSLKIESEDAKKGYFEVFIDKKTFDLLLETYGG